MIAAMASIRQERVEMTVTLIMGPDVETKTSKINISRFKSVPNLTSELSPGPTPNVLI